MDIVRNDMSLVSVIIPVRDRWDGLNRCLQSLTQAQHSTDYEVIVIDDGSKEVPPPEIEEWKASLPIKLIRQVPLGVAAARNLGILSSTGDVLLFIDSDCVLDGNFLANLTASIDSHPHDIAFQPKIIGGGKKPGAIVDNLRLTAVQQSLVADGGYIRYVDTAGFAIRRSFLDGGDLFDLSLRRGEDTSILLKLYEKGKLPRYVPEAVVEHAPDRTVCQYVLRHFGIGYHTGPARHKVKKSKILMNTSQWWNTFRNLRKIRAARKYSRFYLFATMLAYILELLGRFAYVLCGIRPGRTSILSTHVDPVTQEEVQARIISSAVHRRGMFVTYLTGWSLVLSHKDPQFRQLLNAADLCYADGAGVVFSMLCSSFRRLKKVTANDFYFQFFEEIANRELSFALIGGEQGVADAAAARITERVPSANCVFRSSGYFSDETPVIDKLLQLKPHVVILAMGQPIQEERAYRWSRLMPDTVFYCVGGLFDVISGRVTIPPVWVRHCGFEWLHRLVHSPRLLWRRYVLGIPILGLYILRSFFVRVFHTFQRKLHA